MANAGVGLSTAPVLFPYQLEGAKWLTTAKFRYLADEMGLGKSAQAITALDYLQTKRVIVVCPAVGRLNWANEFACFSSRLRPIPLLRMASLPSGSSVIVSYDSLQNSALLSYLKSLAPYALVLDEAHYLKNLEAKRTAAILSRNGLIHGATNIVALSGTPMPNNPSELWPILYTMGATTLPYSSWADRFCQTRPTPFGQKIIGTKKTALPELKSLLGRVVLRRTKAEVMPQLPPISIHHLTVNAAPVEPAYFLEAVLDPENLHRKVKKQGEIVHAALKDAPPASRDTLLVGLNNVSTSTWRQYTGMSKVPAIVEIIDEALDAGAFEKVVIFACHVKVIELLRDGLRHHGAVNVYGGTDPVERKKRMEKFQTNPRCKVFIGNFTAAGIGVNLTAAHYVIVAEPDWVPAVNQQAIMRCHRIGQTKPVTVYFIELEDSIDQLITRTLERKTRDLIELNLA